MLVQVQRYGRIKVVCPSNQVPGELATPLPTCLSCTNGINLATMAAEPRDLIAPGSLEGSEGVMGADAVLRHWDGQGEGLPATDRHEQLIMAQAARAVSSGMVFDPDDGEREPFAAYLTDDSARRPPPRRSPPSAAGRPRTSARAACPPRCACSASRRRPAS